MYVYNNNVFTLLLDKEDKTKFIFYYPKPKKHLQIKCSNIKEQKNFTK